jgi:hypothetical protein
MSSNARETSDTVIATVVAALLGYMAFDGAWHAALFGFIAFNTTAQGNRSEQTLRTILQAIREGQQ